MVLLKRAQTETVGLVIIIIIIAFSLIFALQFLTKSNDNKINEQYLKLNADNLRSVILKTTISSCNIKDEIISCNNFNAANCLESCEKLNLVIKDIIEKSIRNNYEFSAGNINLKKGDCLNKNKQASSVQPFPETQITVSIKLC